MIPMLTVCILHDLALLAEAYNLTSLLKHPVIVHPAFKHDDGKSNRDSGDPLHRIVTASVAYVYVSIVLLIVILMSHTDIESDTLPVYHLYPKIS